VIEASIVMLDTCSGVEERILGATVAEIIEEGGVIFFIDLFCCKRDTFGLSMSADTLL
jgi:hypothetical protein